MNIKPSGWWARHYEHHPIFIERHKATSMRLLYRSVAQGELEFSLNRYAFNMATDAERRAMRQAAVQHAMAEAAFEARSLLECQVSGAS